MSSQYLSPDPQIAPRNLARAIGKRLRLQGIQVSDHEPLRSQFLHDMTGWLHTGHLTHRETLFHGLDRAPEALLATLLGATTGKPLVTLHPGH